VTCPLCFYNLDHRQEAVKETFLDFQGLPVLFFTQLLAWALGVDKALLGLKEHSVAADGLFDAHQAAEVRS
jgi:heterodisulfide reductase subunit B